MNTEASKRSSDRYAHHFQVRVHGFRVPASDAGPGMTKQENWPRWHCATPPCNMLRDPRSQGPASDEKRRSAARTYVGKDTLGFTHVGRNPEANFGVVNPPVYHASTILSKNMAEWEAKRAAPPFSGVRWAGSTATPGDVPARGASGRRSKAGIAAMLMSSGLAAVTAPLQARCSAPATHCLMVDSAYGPARNFCEGILKKCGVETTYYNPLMGAGIADLMRPNTKVVYCESPGSITFEIQDIPAIAAVAHRHGAKVLMDTAPGARPYLFPQL